MTSRGPVLTMLAVAAFGAVLLVVNATHPEAVATAAAAAKPAVTAAATPAPTPSPVVAPPPRPAVAQAVFAGRTAGKEATVAIAVKDGKAVAYVCDGKKVEAWLDGRLTGDTLELTGPGGATLTAKATPDTAAGEVTVGARTWPFTARAAGRPAGLYEGRSDVKGVASRVGWIVLPDGAQVGIRTVAGADPQPAPALDPVALAAQLDGAPVQVRALTGAERGA
jgi:hypothetical protein